MKYNTQKIKKRFRKNKSSTSPPKENEIYNLLNLFQNIYHKILSQIFHKIHVHF